MLIFRKWIMMFIVITIIVSMAKPVRSHEITQELVMISREREVLAFCTIGNRWVVKALMAREGIMESQTTSHVAVVVTNFRVLAFSAETDRWDELKLETGEKVVSLEARGRMIAVATNERAMGFSSRKGIWQTKRFLSK